MGVFNAAEAEARATDRLQEQLARAWADLAAAHEQLRQSILKEQETAAELQQLRQNLRPVMVKGRSKK